MPNFTIKGGNVHMTAKVYVSQEGWQYLVAKRVPAAGRIYLTCTLKTCNASAVIKVISRQFVHKQNWAYILFFKG